MIESNYRISKQAIDDINDIWLYTYHTWSKTQADSYHDLIFKEIERVSENFILGRSVDHIRKNYRVTKIKSHLIFYNKSADGKIEVVRILHQRMDVKKKLS
jgi:toxin ParE1/3/4